MAETAAWPSGVIHFPEGIPGFESLRDFVLLQDEELLPIVFLSSLSEPKVCFPVLPMQNIEREYRLDLGEDDRRVLRLAEEPAAESAPEEQLLCLAILNLGDGSRPPSANLFAPIVINLANWTAKQVIQFESSYPAALEV